MKIKIHRGTNQIGSCISEIESNCYKVFIDFGEQLPGAEKIDLPIFIGKTALEIYNCLESKLSFIRDPAEAEKHKKIVERIKTINTFEQLVNLKFFYYE